MLCYHSTGGWNREETYIEMKDWIFCQLSDDRLFQVHNVHEGDGKCRIVHIGANDNFICEDIMCYTHFQKYNPSLCNVNDTNIYLIGGSIEREPSRTCLRYNLD